MQAGCKATIQPISIISLGVCTSKPRPRGREVYNLYTQILIVFLAQQTAYALALLDDINITLVYWEYRRVGYVRKVVSLL